MLLFSSFGKNALNLDVSTEPCMPHTLSDRTFAKVFQLKASNKRHMYVSYTYKVEHAALTYKAVVIQQIP